MTPYGDYRCDVGMALTDKEDLCGNGIWDDREECEIGDDHCSLSCQCIMGYEMDPCFWTDAGDVREAAELSANGNPGPCRTVC